jgi:hypothetical protein
MEMRTEFIEILTLVYIGIILWKVHCNHLGIEKLKKQLDRLENKKR